MNYCKYVHIPEVQESNPHWAVNQSERQYLLHNGQSLMHSWVHDLLVVVEVFDYQLDQSLRMWLVVQFVEGFQ
jgi:hypothetical protein